MVLIMGVSLFTSRIILNVLGVEDFGIYNVVGGVVVLFSYLNSAMTASTQRFISFEIGRENPDGIRNIFNMGLNIHIIFTVLFLVIAETIGLWLIRTQLVIPENRLFAANFVYQFSVISTAINILTIPYTSLIIAHERMNVFAYFSIAETMLKLIIVFLLTLDLGDKLIVYSILYALITVLIRLIYYIYCRYNFTESRFLAFWSTTIFKEMFFFTGWNFFGATAGVSMNQGTNILMNIFFGPAVNAARGIATQVQGVISQFVTNFMQAVNPQIVMKYASGKKEEMFLLVSTSSKLSFFLMAIISLPFIIKMEFIINLWLGKVPEYSVLFTQLMIIYQLTISLTYPINTASQASGKVKLFQITEGTILLLILPVSYFQLKVGFQAYTVLVTMIILSSVAFVARLFVLKKTIGFPLNRYFNDVLLKVFLVTLMFGIIYFAVSFIPSTSFLSELSLIFLVFFSSIAFVYFLGLNYNEKQFIKNKVNSLLKTKSINEHI